MSSCTCSCSATRRRRPSAALVVATLALFLSMGGTSYAAIKAGSVGNKQLASNAVSAKKIRTGAVTSTKVATNAVTATKVRSGAITSAKLGNGAVTGSKIARNAVTSQSVLDGSLGGQDIARGSLGTQHIAPGSINTSNLSPDVVGRLLAPWTDSQPVGGVASPGISTRPLAPTDVRAYSVPASAAGTVLLQGQAAVRANDAADITCGISRERSGVRSILIEAPVSVVAGSRAVIPVQVVAPLRADDVVRLSCSTTSGSAFVDVRTSTVRSTLSATRIAD